MPELFAALWQDVGEVEPRVLDFYPCLWSSMSLRRLLRFRDEWQEAHPGATPPELDVGM